MKKYSLPNLSSDEQVICHYNILNNLYTFEFTRCDLFFLLDIYTENRDGKSYLVKGVPLILGANLLRNTTLNERLILENIYNEKIEPEKENLHTDFELVCYD